MNDWRGGLSIVLALALVAPGCASSGPGRVVRAAVDTPTHFLVGSFSGPETSEPGPGPACRNPMVDPRDGTRLRLDSSMQGQGDYEVPAGRYGVGPGEWLRLDCSTGRAVGIVGRR